VRTGDADPSSRFNLKQKQSDYLRLQITGGERDPAPDSVLGRAP
jgi:hypothetical protein